ncbi:hypothetical protein [Mycolicibacterium austroafricanum]|uniref:hypothetical protein n=1 Tax=Mycolicibacterium austroafricanum TaxID=39687 RepID=UPI001CA379C8|nr:hypothetical protein [Mycolicibacterium austroafricanum]QZT55183.1 hypothetical protein JN084_19565 [Mycolicibacterium austroafricanum]
MHVAVRSPLATGVALVGAGAIALTPVHPSLPDISVPAVSSMAVQLTAQPNPIALWTEVFAGAINNIGGLGEDLLSDPFPVLNQILRNQFGYLQTIGEAGKGIIDGLVEYASPDNPFGLQAGIRDAVAQFKAGDIGAAFTTLASTVITGPIIVGAGLPLLMSGLLEVPVKMAQNFTDAVAALLNPTTAVPLITAALGPILGPFSALGASVQDFVEALGSGDVLDAITTVINVPAKLVGAALNGFTDEGGNFFAGILTVSDDPFSAGLLQTLLVTVPRAVAAALGAEDAPARVAGALGEVSSPISEHAAAVTVSVTETDSATTEVDSATEVPAAEPEETPTAPAEEAPVEEAPAEERADTSAEDGAVQGDAEVTDGEPVVDEAADGDDAPTSDDTEADDAGADEGTPSDTSAGDADSTDSSAA